MRRTAAGFSFVGEVSNADLRDAYLDINGVPPPVENTTGEDDATLGDGSAEHNSASRRTFLSATLESGAPAASECTATLDERVSMLDRGDSSGNSKVHEPTAPTERRALRERWAAKLDDIAHSPVVVTPAVSFSTIHDLFALMGLTHVWVIDRGLLLGVITLPDMIRATFKLGDAREPAPGTMLPASNKWKSATERIVGRINLPPRPERRLSDSARPGPAPQPPAETRSKSLSALFSTSRKGSGALGSVIAASLERHRRQQCCADRHQQPEQAPASAGSGRPRWRSQLRSGPPPQASCCPAADCYC